MTPENRIKRLKNLIKNSGFKNQKNLAAAIGVNASYLSHLINGHRRFSDMVARGFEEKLGLDHLYFDLGFDEIFKELDDSVDDDLISEINRFKILSLGESCQLSADTIATRVVGGWIYTIKHYQVIDGKTVSTDSSCFAPFTTQHDLNGMVDELIAKL